MAECDEAASPGVGTYAKAAGTGLFTRLATPVVALAVALKMVANSPPPTTPDETKVRLATAAVFGGVGTAVGIVGGPFIATREATKAVRDTSQQLFERCLVARGYRPPPTGIPAPRVLLLVEHKRTPATAVEAFRRELERRGYVFGTTLEVDVQWWDGPRASAGVFVTPWDVVVAPSGEAASAAQRVLPRVPVVVAGSDIDLVAAGLADSLSEPRRNVTGLSLVADELRCRTSSASPYSLIPTTPGTALRSTRSRASRPASRCGVSTSAPTPISSVCSASFPATASRASSCCRIDACGDTGTRWRRSRSANGCRRSPARSASVMPAACSSFIRPSTAPGARRRRSWTAFSRVRRWDRCRSPRWPNATWS
jgi:hypothetical protein